MNKHVEKALFFFQRRPEMAAKELLAALDEEPDDSYTHALLGLCLMNAKDKEGAFAQVKEAIKLDPEHAFAFYALAKCNFDALNMLDAEVAIDEALALEPHNASYWGLLSNIQIEQGELKQALKSAETGLEMSPEDVHCHNLRALLKTKLGQKEEAQKSLDTAMAAAPQDALTHAYRGWTLIEHHNHKESIGHFREALRLDPALEWARLGLVKALQVRHWLFQLQIKLKNGGALAIIALLIAVMYGLPLVFQSPTGLLAQAIGLTIFLCGVGITFFIILFILLWVIPQVTDPILRFFLVFDADGRLAMTQEERNFNVHLMAFVTAGLIAAVYAANFSAWWVLAPIAFTYFLTMPLTMPAEKRDKKLWLSACGMAVFIGGFALLCAFHQFGRDSLRISLAYVLTKTLLSAGGLKAIIGAVGLGAAATAMKAKEKQKIREQMLKQQNDSTKKAK